MIIDSYRVYLASV